MSGDRGKTVVGCVLAGGRSSRMGQDKSSLVVRGESFLARATRALATVCSRVVISGTMTDLPAGLAVVPDEVRDRGPLGGISAALRFVEKDGAEWVMFLPVDMPLLPTTLLPVLLALWKQGGQCDTYVCCAETDGVLQPLISRVHVGVAPFLEDALKEGGFRVGPELRRGAEGLARQRGTRITHAFACTRVTGGDPDTLEPAGWKPTRTEWERRSMWFLNVNTPADLQFVEQALQGHRTPGVDRGSMSQ